MRPSAVRIDPGLLLAGAASLPLIFLLFGSWFCLPSRSLANEGAILIAPQRCWNAWTSFQVIDLLLLFTALAAIAAVVLTTVRTELPVKPGPVLTVLAGLCFLLVCVRLISPPWAGAGRATAPFIALLCLAVIAGGGMLSSRRGTTVRSAGHDQKKGRGDGRGPRPGRRRTTNGTRSEAPAFRDFNREGRL
ncbi:MAG: hypothetical protein M9938_08145 [Solirubrobacterales bacterium]|nr:hypothetical protein [Solirubrobacterales bacterium]